MHRLRCRTPVDGIVRHRLDPGTGRPGVRIRRPAVSLCHPKKTSGPGKKSLKCIAVHCKTANRRVSKKEKKINKGRCMQTPPAGDCAIVPGQDSFLNVGGWVQTAELVFATPKIHGVSNLLPVVGVYSDVHGRGKSAVGNRLGHLGKS